MSRPDSAGRSWSREGLNLDSRMVETAHSESQNLAIEARSNHAQSPCRPLTSTSPTSILDGLSLGGFGSPHARGEGSEPRRGDRKHVGVLLRRTSLATQVPRHIDFFDKI